MLYLKIKIMSKINYYNSKLNMILIYKNLNNRNKFLIIKILIYLFAIEIFS